MKWTLGLFVVIAMAVGGLSIWTRARPVPAEALAWPQGTWEPGDHQSRGGIVAVRTPQDPRAAFSRLAGIIANTPRTEIREGGPNADRMIAVTRSRVMGFPDVTHVWTEDGRIYVSGHLVMGAGDLGVNARRVRGWLERAGL